MWLNRCSLKLYYVLFVQPWHRPSRRPAARRCVSMAGRPLASNLQPNTPREHQLLRFLVTALGFLDEVNLPFPSV